MHVSSKRNTMLYPFSFFAMFCIAMAAVFLMPAGLAAQEEGEEEGQTFFESIAWETGPCTSKLGVQAEIEIPEGYMFAGAADTLRIMEAFGNPTDGTEMGCIFPADEEQDWFVVFEFADIGYIEDAEDEDLDADAILESIKEGNKQGNRERASRGWAEMTIIGWEREPNYNPETNNLEWAIRAESEGEPVLNYNTRILGRHGYMSANLVIDPADLAGALPEFQQLLEGFSYVEGKSYAEFRSGDKIAEYGLAALITGGAAAVAIKTGLLQKFWKLIVVGVVAVGAAIKKVFTRK